MSHSVPVKFSPKFNPALSAEHWIFSCSSNAPWVRNLKIYMLVLGNMFKEVSHTTSLHTSMTVIPLGVWLSEIYSRAFFFYIRHDFLLSATSYNVFDGTPWHAVWLNLPVLVSDRLDFFSLALKKKGKLNL